MEKHNKITKKNKYFKGFQIVTYENLKMYAKYLILRNEKTLQEKCIISVLSFLGTKTLKDINSITLYGKK